MRRRRKIAIWGLLISINSFGLKFGASGVDLLLPVAKVIGWWSASAICLRASSLRADRTVNWCKSGASGRMVAIPLMTARQRERGRE